MLSLQEKQERSVRKYTTQYYSVFNRGLRQNLMPITDEHLIDYVNIWNYLDSRRSPNQLITFRGTSIPPRIE